MKTLKKVTDLKENEVIHLNPENGMQIYELLIESGIDFYHLKSMFTKPGVCIFVKKKKWDYYQNLDVDVKIHPAKDFIPKVTKKELLNRIEKLEDQLLRQTWVIDEGTKEEAKEMFSNKIPLTMDYESFIGKEMKGFKFDCDNPRFNINMEIYIDKIGVINRYSSYHNSFVVIFPSNESYYYPADLAIQHIVEDTTTNLQVPVTDNEKEKVLLYLDMLEHARSVNGDWVPDWSEVRETKYTLDIFDGFDIIITIHKTGNQGIFGIAYQTKEKAQQAKEKFIERILKYYGN